MDTLKKIWKYVSTILSYSALVILIIIGIIFTLYVVDVKVQESKGGTAKPLFGAYVIISGSMEPNIHVYDVIISKRVDPSTLEVGDVITFHSNDTRFYGETVTHRIVEVIDSKKGIYRTKGDANNVEDEALTVGENIMGKVVMRIPHAACRRFISQTDYTAFHTGSWFPDHAPDIPLFRREEETAFLLPTVPAQTCFLPGNRSALQSRRTAYLR